MTDTWAQQRAQGVGASDVAGILDISPWATPYSVWQAKVSGGSAGDAGNIEALRWGHLLEDAILAEVERRLDVHVFGKQTRCAHPEVDWALANVDAFYSIEGKDYADGVIEVKTTSDPRWDDVPVYYQAQVQWQLEITDLPHAWVATLHNGRRLSLHSVERDREIGQALLAETGRFWFENVLAGNPPPVDGRPATSDALAARYADTEPEMVADLSAMSGKVDELRLVRVELADLESERDRLENEIKQALGPAEVGEVDGTRVVTWKQTTSKRLDQTRLRDEHPQLAAEYMTETSTRRFLLTKPRKGPA